MSVQVDLASGTDCQRGAVCEKLAALTECTERRDVDGEVEHDAGDLQGCRISHR